MTLDEIKFNEKYFVATKGGLRFVMQMHTVSSYERIIVDTVADLSALATNEGVIKTTPQPTTPAPAGTTNTISGAQLGTANLQKYFDGKKITVGKVEKIIQQDTAYLKVGMILGIWDDILVELNPAVAKYRYLLTIDVDETSPMAGELLAKMETSIVGGLKEYSGVKHTLKHISYDNEVTDYADVNRELQLQSYERALDNFKQSTATLITKSTHVAEVLSLDTTNKKLTEISTKVQEIYDTLGKYTS